MIVIAFEANDECYKFVNTCERINDIIFTRGDNVTFENECRELDEYISHSQICDDLDLFGFTDLKGREIKQFGLTTDMCVKFGLKHYS